MSEKMTSKEAFPLLAKMFGIDETMARAVTIHCRVGDAVIVTVERFTESRPEDTPIHVDMPPCCGRPTRSC